MNVRPTLASTNRQVKVAWAVAIIALATTAGVVVSWRAPSLNTFAQDHLMRLRGNLSEPEDIVIVAIDESSISRFGQFPWKRELTARILNNISAAQPKAIALDILYSEATDKLNDLALAESIRKAGNVAIAEQLVRDRHTPELGRSEWLKALPEFEDAAAGSGHVNVETEADGAARKMLLKLADDDGESRWALAIETIRVGDHLNENDISNTSRFVRVGSRKIPFEVNSNNLTIKLNNQESSMSVTQPMEMPIDYIGPTGSFEAQTYSFSDVLDGKISPERFRGKYVLVGATAAALGDNVATPFIHDENAEGDQHGDLMPGVEVLANTVNTILRGNFYEPVSDLAAAFLAGLIGAMVLLITRLAEGRFEAVKQLGYLTGLAILIYFGSYLVFLNALIVPPVVPMFVAFGVAVPLGLLRRSLTASASFDQRISEMLVARDRLMSGKPGGQAEKFGEQPPETTDSLGDEQGSRFLPHGLEWKTRTLGSLSRDLIERAVFIESALRSIEDGLMIADLDGRITFVNPSVSRMLGMPERKLIGSGLFALLSEAENKPIDPSVTNDTDEPLGQLLFDRQTIQREIVIGNSTPRSFVLKIATVAERNGNSEEPIGILATLSDITAHRQLEKTKNDVIALVTHELRTPLTAIQGMSEVLAEHDVPPDSQRKMLTTINSEARRLAKMINDYLDITRLEAGRQRADFTLVNVEYLIERTLMMLEPLAARRGMKIIRRFLSKETQISADEERLGQAVTNIVANAIKYSPPDTSITVETISDSRVMMIRVSDEGIGISAEQLPNVFKKFFRVPQRNSADVSGTGLGLALTQEIAELHGGYITVESEVGKGSTFTVFLPILPES